VFSDQPAAEAELVEELVVNDVDPSVLVEAEPEVEPEAELEAEATSPVAEAETLEESPAAADEPATGSDETTAPA
jgi:hypothetical protein